MDRGTIASNVRSVPRISVAATGLRLFGTGAWTQPVAAFLRYINHGSVPGMASTPDGEEVQKYINEELKRRQVNAVATVVEGQDNLDYGVHIRGAIPAEHFLLKGAYGIGLSDSVKQSIASALDAIGNE